MVLTEQKWMYMSKDSVLIAFHDSKFEEATLCSGTINDKLWSEIWGCHYASPISSKINLLSINDLFDRLENDGYNLLYFTFTFDCKLYTNSSDGITFLNQYANAILKLMDDRNVQNNILVESSDTTFLRILQNKRNGLKLFTHRNFENGFQIAKTMNLYGITLHTDYISTEQIKMAHENGLRVTLFGIGFKNKNVEAVLKSPDFIQTDKPIHLLKIFGKYKGDINDKD